MKIPLNSSPTDDCERPQQPWRCGLSDEGAACPLGPSHWGKCPAAAACRPARDGDRWVCNRSALRGGPCDAGPSPSGECCTVYRCTPLRSLRNRRGQFVLAVLLTVVGAGAMLLSSDARHELVAPGPLTAAHSRVVAENSQDACCARCHAAGGGAIDDWLHAAVSADQRQPTQSTLCVRCHQDLIETPHATSAHTMSSELLAAASVENGQDESAWRRDWRQPLACATCHREHLGQQHDLTAVTDQTCHACHQSTFASFASGHPEFTDWPYAQPTRIAFDHASHELKHFPDKNQSYACASCHRADSTGRGQLTLSYDATCASCHDEQITHSLADGVPLLSLPFLDIDSLTNNGHDIGGWPDEATDDFDGATPAVAKLLVAATDEGAAALHTLEPDFDFFDVDANDPQQLAAAAAFARQLRLLVDEFADEGHATVERRAEVILGRSLSAEELAQLTGRLSPDVMRSYRERWFGEGGATLANNETREAQRARLAGGGWVCDELSMAICYHPTGHADPWMRAWINVLAEATSGPHGETAGSLLQLMMKPTAPGLCGSCHTIRKSVDGELAVQWRPLDTVGRPRGFTFFDHGPHVLQTQLADCQTCHQIESSGTPADAAVSTVRHDTVLKPTSAAHVGALRNDLRTTSLSTLAPVGGEGRVRGIETTKVTFARSTAEFKPSDRSSRNGFVPLRRAGCAECHTPAAAGGRCTQCHNYHVHVGAGGK